MSGWRCWFAFEVRPGITLPSVRDSRAEHRALAESCRKADGKIDTDEFMYWTEMLVEHMYQRGQA